jgi:transcriptional regulator with XRE-family HTH domain
MDELEIRYGVDRATLLRWNNGQTKKPDIKSLNAVAEVFAELIHGLSLSGEDLLRADLIEGLGRIIESTIA